MQEKERKGNNSYRIQPVNRWTETDVNMGEAFKEENIGKRQEDSRCQSKTERSTIPMYSSARGSETYQLQNSPYHSDSGNIYAFWKILKRIFLKHHIIDAGEH